MTIVLHLLPHTEFRAGEGAPIHAPSLKSQGFLHCSPDVPTTLAVADTWFRDASEQIVALEVDTDRLSVPVRWEAADPAPPPGVSNDVQFPHVYGPLDRDAITAIRYARRDISGRYVGLERRGPVADEFDLLPHPEGGWYRRTWTAPTVAPTPSGRRSSATAIYFVLAPGETSQWHTVASDELWLWHYRGALRLELGGDGECPEQVEPVTLDSTGPQALVPAGTWQRAVNHSDSETLVSCVVSPGFDFADFRTL